MRAAGVGGLVAAFQFLTVVPLPRVRTGVGDLGAAVAWFPVVGLALGGALVVEDLALRAALGPALRSALEMTSLAMLTGGIHLDGFADTCDGVFSRKPPAERLLVMRDSRLGSFAAVGLVCLLVTKWAALAGLPDALRLSGLALAPMAGRWAMALAVLTFPAAGGGLGEACKGAARRRHLVAATVLALAAAEWLLGGLGLALLALCGAGCLLLGMYLCAKLPGLTGDTYGAVDEVLEVLCLVALMAWAGGGRG